MHHQTNRDWLCWGQLLWRLHGYILTNLGIVVCRTLNCLTLNLSLGCRTLSLILECRTLIFICRTLHCIHKLILSIRISGVRGIGSIHLFSNLLPTQIYLKVFLTLILCYFSIYFYINISFFSFGKVYLTDFTKISQIECYSRFLKAETHSHIRLLSLHLTSILCQHI